MRIAIVGVGKIARDQHVPAISGSHAFDLAATVSRSGGIPAIENFAEFAELLAARPDVSAVSLCMPPQVRFAAAAAAIRAGRHVMLEKPPGATVAEVRTLRQMAEAEGVTLYATWHSRHADAVAPAKAWLRDRKIVSVRIDWKEDVRKWHPGQAWIWEPGGLGVFDPGINALSILTEILPAPVHLTGAELHFPENRAAPIAAALTFEGPDGVNVTAEFDWRQEGGEIWQIAVDTADGRLDLDDGGARLTVGGAPQAVDGPGEYPGLYARFAALIAAGDSDVDDTPLVRVADAFMLGRRLTVAPFND
ncbi:MAG: Gfo/Idh/MocA family oxidoreductase [Rhodobacteraceae bacterium]|nr:Gfo/Idh/MocA family oxidoreductase [Paracoccaceae bacterium]